ncbi:MAG: hypothetical protein QW165_04620 [Candidatus Woesearchaeota archaeon]
MDKKKENLLANLMLAGALSAVAIYGIAKLKQNFDKPDVKVSVNIPNLYVSSKEVVAEIESNDGKKDGLLSPLEQVVIDEKTGLAVVGNRDGFEFYGSRVLKGGKYRQVDRDLYELLMQMADAYKTEFKQKLFVGPMWDDQGHSKNSKHYKGLAVDIDFGANVGTEQYKKSDRKKAEFLLRYIQKYAKEHNKNFKVIFNDKEFVREGLCVEYPGHHNHIHIGK